MQKFKVEILFLNREFSDPNHRIASFLILIGELYSFIRFLIHPIRFKTELTTIEIPTKYVRWN